MALTDLGVFIQERLQLFDASMDVSSGSPADVTIIQPILRRLGTDPFSVDFGLFAQDRLQQEFPDLATKEGDSIVDLLIKPSIVLFDPIIREIVRVKQGQSFKDPSVLTVEEAESLAANLFTERDRGNVSKGQVRVYYAAPQKASVSPANFVSSKGGLHFFPTANQSLSVEEMLFNVEGGLYYFDVNLQAEFPGEQYNIGPDELVSIANITAAVRITNKRRFRFGTAEENAANFIDRSQQDLTERSLVTERGVVAQLTKAFPEVQRVAVVGFNDPEMQRDVIKGGGLGGIVAGGFLMEPAPDEENHVLTRRIRVNGSEVPLPNFTALLGPVGPVTGFTITLFGMFGSVPQVRDVAIRAVVDSQTLDLVEQSVDPGAGQHPWTIRETTLTLSGIPGGILFPDGPQGTVNVPNGQIHIGGAVDMLVRGTDFDTGVLVLDAVVDDNPLLQGTQLTVLNTFGDVQLNDLVQAVTYADGSSTSISLKDAYAFGYTLQIENGPAAGNFRVIGMTQANGLSPVARLTPAPSNPPGNFRWRLLDVLDIALDEPKETKAFGSDLITTQNVDSVTTAGGLDFDNLGVGVGDILKILNGPDEGEFTIKQVQAPLFQRIQVDRPLTASRSTIKYQVFRRNKEGGVALPLIRITSIDLLDSSGQPVGSKVPFAKPVDIRSRGFANAAHGVKVDLTDVFLGIVSNHIGAANVSGQTLIFNVEGIAPVTVTFTGVNPLSINDVVNQVNSQLGTLAATIVDSDRIGILPIGPGTSLDETSTALTGLFGNSERRACHDIRSAEQDARGGWGVIMPAIDVNYDVAQVLDGFQIGFYIALSVGTGVTTALLCSSDFLPEVRRHVQIGARSLGTARSFFLEPTSIEFNLFSKFSVVLSSGQTLNYYVDPTNSYQRVPGLPNDPTPKDGVASATTHVFTSASSDFFQEGVQIGDELVVTYQPITGTVALADPVTGLVNTTLIVSVGGGVDKTIIFVNDSTAIPNTDVTRQGVADQINKAIGQKLCIITGSNNLEFEGDVSIIIRLSGSANTSLGFSTLLDTTNTASAQGTYHIVTVGPTTLTTATTDALFLAGTRQHFHIVRPKLQRIIATQMSSQLDTAGLYYFDLQLVSEGTGDEYNIDSDLQMTATGYISDGYWLSTEDSNLTFSNVERPILHVSRSILEVGVSDSPANATQISGQNLQVNYERSSLTSSIQGFVSSETERVVNESPLARHLIPYYVRFDFNYVGGSKEDVLRTDMNTFINALDPNAFLHVSDLEGLAKTRGALSVSNPIDLVAIIHNFDRSVTAERSQNKINTGRLAAFIPDILNIKRTVG